MRKVIMAFDGFHFSDGAFEFARMMNEKENILLAGVFLPQVSYANLWAYADGAGAPVFVPVLDKDDTEKIEENISKFEEKCKHNGIEFRVRKDFSDLALPELKKESRFSDLMIIGSERFYEGMGTGEPNTYVKDALHELECCVIVVPEHFSVPSINILAYDGSASSVYAIKQFAYLLPELKDNPTLLTYANEDGTHKIPFEPYIEELSSRHFSDLTISKLDIDSKKYYSTWVGDQGSAIIAAGSFGRSAFSQLFKKSFIAEVIKDHRVPVFIGHH